MKAKPNQKGFTLIELLVVITIIAILASVSVPVFSSIQQKAKVYKSMQQVSGIYKGVYALYGEDGFLPSGDNANDILAEVAVEMDSEKPFYVAGCAWHGNGQTKTGGDNFHERSTPQGIALEPGANLKKCPLPQESLCRVFSYLIKRMILMHLQQGTLQVMRLLA